jgi:hypothetical protein
VHDPRPSRPLLALAAGAAAALAVAVPAGASEGPTGPPPPPWGMAPPTIQPAPGTGTGGAAPSATVSRPGIRSARIVPRRVRRGKRATLRMSLSRAGRVRLVITRTSKPKRGRVIVRQVSKPSGKIAIKLPRGVGGRALATGRYRVTVVVTDGQGSRSRTVRRSFVVRAAHS